MKRLKLGLVPALLLLLAACSNDSPAMVKVSLAPVPYSIEVPAQIAKHLSIENMVTSTPNEYTKQAQEAGAIAQVYINYKAADGTMHGFAGVYYFKKADYEKSANPTEPPVYGTVVAEENSMVLLVYGPQEPIFEPTSQDGKDSTELYRIIYQPFSYKALK